MSRGISLHVGVNKVGPNFPNAATLKGCENDAWEMEKIAQLKGFEPHRLIGPNASYLNVIDKIRYAATELQKGDIFLFTFAGHGFQEADRGEQDEADFEDETILLYDFELYDDVLRQTLWPQFRPGVRILMIADSCHSGTVAMRIEEHTSDSVEERSSTRHRDSEIVVLTPDGLVARTVSAQTMRQHRSRARRFYEQPFFPIIDPPIHASVLLLAACGDAETTGDGDTNGVFTAAMLKVLNQSNPQDYRDFIRKISTELAGHPQMPTLTPIQPADEVFIAQRPFTI
jgi:hypothetical protein